MSILGVGNDYYHTLQNMSQSQPMGLSNNSPPLHVIEKPNVDFSKSGDELLERMRIDRMRKQENVIEGECTVIEINGKKLIGEGE
jgi:hypothetical protein